MFLHLMAIYRMLKETSLIFQTYICSGKFAAGIYTSFLHLNYETTSYL